MTGPEHDRNRTKVYTVFQPSTLFQSTGLHFLPVIHLRSFPRTTSLNPFTSHTGNSTDSQSSFIMGATWSQLFPPTPTLTEKNLPDQKGKVFIVTGGASGVGFELATTLFQAGGKVYIAGRSEAKARQSIDRIKALTHDAPGPSSSPNCFSPPSTPPPKPRLRAACASSGPAPRTSTSRRLHRAVGWSGSRADARGPRPRLRCALGPAAPGAAHGSAGCAQEQG